MAATLSTQEPHIVRAGDTWQWRRDDLPDTPASAWVLTYYFRNATAYFDVIAAADGDLFAVTVPKATTAGIDAAVYDWIAVVESATERFQVDAGTLTVQPDLSAAAAFDARTFARTMLDAVEAALLSKATTRQLDLVQAALADRSMQYNNATLMTLRRQLQNEVSCEMATQAGTNTRRLLVRFD